MALLAKELKLFFGNLTGFLSIGLFLLLMGLLLFVFPDTSILDFGYATMDKFFELAPWVLLLLVPAVTMRSFSDEFRQGTWELLKTKPLHLGQIIGGKYLAALIVVVLTLLPTLVYVYTIKTLSVNGSIDAGAIAGSYVGLLGLAAAFTAVGIACSALSANPIVSFLAAAFSCFILYNGFSALSQLAALAGTVAYWVELAGLKAHYQNMSRGVLELRDFVYFLVVVGFFLLLTRRLISSK